MIFIVEGCVWFVCLMLSCALLDSSDGAFAFSWVIFVGLHVLIFAIHYLQADTTGKNGAQKNIQPVIRTVTKPTVIKRPISVSKPRQALILLEKLLETYKSYFTFSDKFVTCEDVFELASLKKSCQKAKFVSEKHQPTKVTAKHELPVLIEVPEESWLEKIMPQKEKLRLEAIRKNREEEIRVQKINDEREKDAEIEYQKALSAYNEFLVKEKQLWEVRETEKVHENQLKNKEIDEWWGRYEQKEEEAILKYIDILFSVKGIVIEPLVSYKVGYNAYGNRVVVDMYLKSRAEIFPVAGYRYVEKHDEIKTTKITTTEQNDNLRILITELSIAIVWLLYRNDKARCFLRASVNAYCEGVCCGSCEIHRDEFNQYDAQKSLAKGEFVAAQMRLFNRITSGVKPYNTLGNLE